MSSTIGNSYAETRVIPSDSGNEFGITNVTSQGRVAITVVPPKQNYSRAKSQPPPELLRGSSRSLQSDSSSHYSQRYITTDRHSISPERLKLRPAQIKAQEKNELDEILKELLGDNPSGGVTSSRYVTSRAGNSQIRTNTNDAGSAYRSYSTSSSTSQPQTPPSTPSGSGLSWLEQQQHKLTQRQISREHENTINKHRQQANLVSELKFIQKRRKQSLDESDFNSNNTGERNETFRMEKEIPLTNSGEQPAAYTVYIRPEAEKEKTETVNKKSITNVSHTHHNHYNFTDPHDSEQKKRIALLEEELNNVKIGLHKQDEPPPRPPKTLDLDEDDDFLFKPVGIANLESGTGKPIVEACTPNQKPPYYHSTPYSVNTQQSNQTTAPDLISTTPVTTPHNPGSTIIQTHHTATSSYSGPTQSVTSPSHSLVSDNPVFGFIPAWVSPGSPVTPYQLLSPVSPPLTMKDYSRSLLTQQQRMSIEEQRFLQNTLSSQGASTHGTNTLTSTHSKTSQALEQVPDSVTAKFVKDTSKYWYKPHLSRDEVVNMLKTAAPGSFIVRDSNSFPGAFGLALHVATLPPNVQLKPGSDPTAEYVRFYLIEPTNKGVKLKGCRNEPVFASLAALIYQHTLTPLALPCKLVLPDPDAGSLTNVGAPTSNSMDMVDGLEKMRGPAQSDVSTASDLLKHGAACNVVYLNAVDMESLTGPQAISRAVHSTFGKEALETTIATFKVSSDGITITDNNRKLFFRQHFSKDSISYCGLDPADRRFTQSLEGNRDIREAKIFGFVAKKKGGNQCFLFSEFEAEQPATAIVNFVSKVLLTK